VQVIDVEVNDVEPLGVLEQLFQHGEVAGQRVDAMRVEPDRLRPRGD